jgi:hypothetical protein
MPRRPNKATIADAGLGAAFTEGVNEGFRLTGYVRLTMRIGSQERFHEAVKASDVPQLVADFVAGLRGEHYGVGVIIRILALDDVKTEPAGELDDGIVDAEVVED